MVRPGIVGHAHRGRGHGRTGGSGRWVTDAGEKGRLGLVVAVLAAPEPPNLTDVELPVDVLAGGRGQSCPERVGPVQEGGGLGEAVEIEEGGGLCSREQEQDGLPVAEPIVARHEASLGHTSALGRDSLCPMGESQHQVATREVASDEGEVVALVALAQHVERPLHRLGGSVHVVPVARGRVVQRLRDLGMGRDVDRLAQGEGAVVVPDRFVDQAERAVGVAEDVVEVGQQVRLVGEVAVDAGGGLVEHGTDGRLGAGGDAVVVPPLVGRAQDLFEEARDGLGAGGLGLRLDGRDLGPVALPVRLGALP